MHGCFNVKGFKKADKYICGECDWLTISLFEFLKHKQQCEMRKKVCTKEIVIYLNIEYQKSYVWTL